MKYTDKDGAALLAKLQPMLPGALRVQALIRKSGQQINVIVNAENGSLIAETRFGLVDYGKGLKGTEVKYLGTQREVTKEALQEFADHVKWVVQ
jgi:hypothetical protein